MSSVKAWVRASRKFIDVLAAALRQVGFAAAAAVEHGAGFAHQDAHVAGGVCGTCEDKARRVFVARREQGDRIVDLR